MKKGGGKGNETERAKSVRSTEPNNWHSAQESTSYGEKVAAGLLSIPHLGVEKLHTPDDHVNVHVLRPTTVDFFWSVSHIDDPEDFKDSTQCFVSTIIHDTHVFSVAHAKPNCRPRLWENVEC
jgi:hypothetical protein